MFQSTCRTQFAADPHPRVQAAAPAPALHVAVIMDGNGRWALRRGLPRTAGHRAGAGAVRKVVRAAAAQGIRSLTLYAFSQDNWQRPAPEVAQLMELFRRHLLTQAERCGRDGVRVRIIGRRDRLDPALRAAIESTEARTREGRVLDLRLAVDYSARDAILEAAGMLARGWPPPGPEEAHPEGAAPSPGNRWGGDSPLSRELFGDLLARALHSDHPLPPVDLLIRTGGERRLSDFLLWESAYAELVFTPCLWPDFGAEELAGALAEFRQRDRRFGGLPHDATLECSPEVRRHG